MILGAVTPYLPSGPIDPYQLDKFISNFRGVWRAFSFLFCFKTVFLLANSEDPDQTPRFAASDLDLHCLAMSQKPDARLIWVNPIAENLCFQSLRVVQRISTNKAQILPITAMQQLLYIIISSYNCNCK